MSEPRAAAVGALVHKADFQRLLGTPPQSRSAHFAVHHVQGRPSLPGRRRAEAEAEKLSTGDATPADPPVDDSTGSDGGGHWLGSVVPKRHARRAVTRSLLKRQIRAALARHLARLPQGLWLVRLKAPFTPPFRSAASDALRHAARDELDALMARLGR